MCLLHAKHLISLSWKNVYRPRIGQWIREMSYCLSMQNRTYNLNPAFLLHHLPRKHAAQTACMLDVTLLCVMLIVATKWRSINMVTVWDGIPHFVAQMLLHQQKCTIQVMALSWGYAYFGAKNIPAQDHPRHRTGSGLKLNFFSWNA